MDPRAAHGRGAEWFDGFATARSGHTWSEAQRDVLSADRPDPRPAQPKCLASICGTRDGRRLPREVRSEKGSPSEAFKKITDFGFPQVVVVLGVAAVIVGTVATQAFEFESIRALEGYWGPGRIREAVARWRCQRHISKRKHLEDRRLAALLASFAYADIEMKRREHRRSTYQCD